MDNPQKPWYVYIVRCRDGSLYTGISDNVSKRIEKHNSGKGAKYTAQRRPVTLLFQETHPDQGSARRREEQIKRWPREKKKQLIAGFHTVTTG